MRVSFLAFLILFISAPDYALTGTGFVHRQGQSVMDGQNQPLKLNAVNLGGWLLWEAWIWGDGFKGETKINRNIARFAGEDADKAFKDSIRTHFITRHDVQAIASLHFNCVRVPFNHRLLEADESHFSERGFQILDSVIQWCEEYHIYVILDMHSLPGGQNGFFIADPEKSKLWGNPKKLNQSARLWAEIARRYSRREIIAGYDLINEPDAHPGKDLVSLYKQITDSIRKSDPDHMLILEGNSFAHDFSTFKNLLDSNQIFSFHFYPWVSTARSRVKKLEHYSQLSKKLNAAFWCGEWGEDKPERLRMIKSLLDKPEYNFCGTAFWTWKKVQISANPALAGIKANPDFIRMIRGKKPSGRNNPAAVLNQFLNAVAFSNCVVDPELKELFK